MHSLSELLWQQAPGLRASLEEFSQTQKDARGFPTNSFGKAHCNLCRYTARGQTCVQSSEIEGILDNNDLDKLSADLLSLSTHPLRAEIFHATQIPQTFYQANIDHSNRGAQIVVSTVQL